MEGRFSNSDKEKVIYLLDIIDECDLNIIHLLKMGRTETSFSVKQERLLMEKNFRELNELLKNYPLSVHFKTEQNNYQSKVA